MPGLGKPAVDMHGQPRLFLAEPGHGQASPSLAMLPSLAWPCQFNRGLALARQGHILLDHLWPDLAGPSLTSQRLGHILHCQARLGLAWPCVAKLG